MPARAARPHALPRAPFRGGGPSPRGGSWERGEGEKATA